MIPADSGITSGTQDNRTNTAVAFLGTKTPLPDPFHGNVGRWMALRLLTYVCLLYQDLIRGGQVKSGGKLPPVFPLVLYNGQPK